MPRSVSYGVWFSAGRENLGQIELHRFLKLSEAAGCRIAIVAPAHPLRGVPEPGALHVLIPDLGDALGPKRHEGQVLAGVPPAALRLTRMPDARRWQLSAPVPGVALEAGDKRLH